MRTSQRGIDLIKSFEGLRLSAYQDSVGVWTIGYGTTRGVTRYMTITVEQAERMLSNDIQRFEPEMDKLVKVPLNQNQWDALMSFVYNLGAANLASSTLLKLLNKGDYQGAADQFPRWVNAGGKRLEGLVKRRAAERALFLERCRDLGPCFIGRAGLPDAGWPRRRRRCVARRAALPAAVGCRERGSGCLPCLPGRVGVRSGGAGPAGCRAASGW